MIATAENLNDLMELDHVITVHDVHGTVSEPKGIWAPELHDGELQSSKWELYGCHSSQQGGGAVMHDCESIGGGLARDILAEPGTYVAVLGIWFPEGDDDELVMEGWAVAKLIED